MKRLRMYQVYLKSNMLHCGEVMAVDESDAIKRAYKRWYFMNVDCIYIK